MKGIGRKEYSFTLTEKFMCSDSHVSFMIASIDEWPCSSQKQSLVFKDFLRDLLQEPHSNPSYKFIALSIHR